MHRIIVIGNGLPVGDNLTGIFQFDQAKALNQNGESVVYFGLDFRSLLRRRRLGYSSGNYQGVEWHLLALPLGRIPTRLFDFIGRRALLWLYDRVFSRKARTAPDIVHAHFTEMGVYASYLSSKRGIPYVITEHSSDVNKKHYTQALIRRCRLAYSDAQRVITVSSGLARSIKENFNFESVVIPNIIDVGTFSGCRPKAHSGFHIATTAVLSDRKRLDQLILSINRLKRDYPDIFLHIIGDGDIKEKLVSIVCKCELTERVYFHGMLNREQTVPIYEMCDCFVLASARETFGVVYVEAIAAGLPVIATICGGPEDFVTKDNGILIEVDSSEQLDAAITFMYEHACQYNKILLKEWAEENYSPHSVANQIIRIYSDVLNHQV